MKLSHATDIKARPEGSHLTMQQTIGLHWFPVWKRVDFKIAILVYRSLSGMTLANLATDCQLSSEEGRRQLRSADSRTYVVRRTYSNFWDRCFTAGDPRLYPRLSNSLPTDLGQMDVDYEQFKRLLKAYLFQC